MPEDGSGVVDEPLEPLIRVVRGQRVILDSDLARIYGVSTRALNQAVKRNAGRFPADFAFQLSVSDLANLKSQTVTSSSNTNQSVTDDRSQIVTTSHGGARKRPWVFGEHGALMAANVLRS